MIKFKKYMAISLLCVMSIACSYAAENYERKKLEDYELRKPQLIMVTLGADNIEQLSSFYENVFDLSFSRSLSDSEEAHHARVASGMFLGINKKHGVQLEQGGDITLHFHVPDLDKYEKAIIEHGGKKIYPFGDTKHVPLSIAERSLESMRSSYTELTRLSPENITNSLGNFALYEDCEKNHVSLIQLEKWAHPYYAHGKIKDAEYKEMMLAFKEGRQFSTFHKK